jgi:hypothetical protein
MALVNEATVVPIPAYCERAEVKTATWSMAAVSGAVGDAVELKLSLDCSLRLGRFGIGLFKPSWLEVTGVALAAYLQPHRLLEVEITVVSVVCIVSGPTRQIEQTVRSGEVLTVYGRIGAASAGASVVVLSIPSGVWCTEQAFGKQAANRIEWGTTNGVITVTE